jgi:uncharacterized paraquat-inducible protein A
LYLKILGGIYMTSRKLKGLVLAIYGVLLDVFALYTLIPLFMEEHLSDAEEGTMVIWILLWILSVILIGIGSSFIGNDTPQVKSSYTQNKASFVKCPNCGEENSAGCNHCFRCGSDLAKKQPYQVSGEWVCPNCGRKNQNYVGTCGCGTRKP